MYSTSLVYFRSNIRVIYLFIYLLLLLLFIYLFIYFYKKINPEVESSQYMEECSPFKPFHVSIPFANSKLQL